MQQPPTFFFGQVVLSREIDRAMQGPLPPFRTPALGLAAEASSHPRLWGQRVVYVINLRVRF